ncbi:hypothetical protein Rhe02_19170 [Rhizocola hellebori]|uniref:Deoxyribonuclease NucA/NucB domain-containing protein n=1 Tax=Rhizocola hellebori TaxID=1392758 RepID=A0A8J3VET0_9ACTN|nr:hypothetical protein [Rhizocola hellebori]GIH03850.1 hypothetical protein Rhe02_19170 [Rhizocola hellebori]
MKGKFALLMLAALMAAMSPVAAAGASQPASTDSQIAPVSTLTPPRWQHLEGLQPTGSQSPADCAAAVQQARASGVTQTSTCTSIELDRTPEPLTIEQQKAVQVITPRCEQTAPPNTGWWASGRRDACSHQQFDIVVVEIPTGIVVGTANMHAILEMSASGATWYSTIGMWVWSHTGTGFPEIVTGNLVGCVVCNGSGSIVQTGIDTWRGTGSFQAGVTPGSIHRGLGGYWALTIGSSKWTRPLLTSLGLAAYRCDNVIGNRLPGCVFGNIPGYAWFSYARNPWFVWHFTQAQLSGLPGRIASGTYLTKLDDPLLVDRNGSMACPPSTVLPRPAGYQCDEYPFRSTREGAYTSGAIQARSIAGCQMPDPPQTGPNGWSRCFIPAAQNSSAGGLLGAFYSDERILDGDKFQVGNAP